MIDHMTTNTRGRPHPRYTKYESFRKILNELDIGDRVAIAHFRFDGNTHSWERVPHRPSGACPFSDILRKFGFGFESKHSRRQHDGSPGTIIVKRLA